MDGGRGVAIDSNATVAKAVTSRFWVGIHMPACAPALLSRVRRQVIQNSVPPDAGRGRGWVLVLDDAARDFPTTGAKRSA